MPPNTQRMQAAGKRAAEAHAAAQRAAKRVTDQIDSLPSTGAPMVEISKEEDNSLVISVEKALRTKEDSHQAIAIARTKSRDI